MGFLLTMEGEYRSATTRRSRRHATGIFSFYCRESCNCRSSDFSSRIFNSQSKRSLPEFETLASMRQRFFVANHGVRGGVAFGFLSLIGDQIRQGDDATNAPEIFFFLVSARCNCRSSVFLVADFL